MSDFKLKGFDVRTVFDALETGSLCALNVFVDCLDFWKSLRQADAAPYTSLSAARANEIDERTNLTSYLHHQGAVSSSQQTLGFQPQNLNT